MILVPKSDKKFNNLIQSSAVSGRSYDNELTGYLNWYYPNWYTNTQRFVKLPFKCNAQRKMHWLTSPERPGYWDQMAGSERYGRTREKEDEDSDDDCLTSEANDGVVVLHYSSTPKPWEKVEKKVGDLEKLWWQHYVNNVAGKRNGKEEAKKG